MTRRASGTFDVQLSPRQPDGQADAAIGWLTIDKQFSGDLTGTSRGQMLAAQGAIQGSAGYVAMEHVNGTLHGRNGTFILMHTGLMARGKPSLTITVVPDSGTGDLAGLAGSMEIVIADSKHSYHFDYTLGDSK
jgi:hypothetical protein